MTQRITKVFDKVLRLQKDRLDGLAKPLISGGVKTLNNFQYCKLQINITLNSLKNQRCVAQWTSPNKKTCIIQSEALALAQADNWPLSYATARWTWHWAMVHSIPVHFMFETFRERGRNGPHGRLWGLGTGLGFQSRFFKKIIRNGAPVVRATHNFWSMLDALPLCLPSTSPRLLAKSIELVQKRLGTAIRNIQIGPPVSLN